MGYTFGCLLLCHYNAGFPQRQTRLETLENENDHRMVMEKTCNL